MIDKKLRDHLDLIMPPAKKELKFIKEHDWSTVAKLDKRESMYNLQSILNDRNISALIKLYSLAEEDLGNPEIRKSIRLLLEFYYILEARYNHVTTAFDWTEFDEADANVEKKMELEIAFQSGVLKDLSSFKERLRKINFGEESDNLDIPIHADKPIPMTMSVAIEERYPEIRQFINKKKEERDV